MLFSEDLDGTLGHGVGCRLQWNSQDDWTVTEEQVADSVGQKGAATSAACFSFIFCSLLHHAAFTALICIHQGADCPPRRSHLQCRGAAGE